MKGLVLLIFITALVSTFHFQGFPYDLNRPAAVIHLPEELREISGISILNEKTLLCVQDELGTVFFYDLSKKKIVRELVFAGPGDYEGIALAKNDLFVLRSDGVIFQIRDIAKSHPSIDSIQTNIPNTNNEGLCYDKKNKLLLIGSKNKVSKEKEVKHLRTIYAYDLTKGKMNPEPKYTLNLKEIRTSYQQQHEITNPGTEKDLKIKISAMFVHPKSHELYILSAQDFFLFTINQEGKTTHIERLDSQIFNKAEGIAIMDNGDLYISNEGQSARGRILQFKPKRK